MTELFQKRRAAFIAQCLKYLRFVLNDHFVLVLLFLMGFLMVQYSNLLRNFPNQHLPIFLILFFIIVGLLGLGRIATYLEPADKLFLLTKEEELVPLIHKARLRSFLVWVSIQTLVLLLLLPIFLKLGLSLGLAFVLIDVLGVIKWFVMLHKSKVLFDEDKLSWDRALAYESNRKQSILKFFSLFTNVKGISTSVRRRKYLDGLLNLVKKKHAKTWENLYLRAFLRSSDYLGLTIRLLLLSLLALIFVPNRLMAAALAIVFNYLLVFQLLALYHHFDYHYLTGLYPVSQEDKAGNLQSFLERISYFLILPELVLTFSVKSALALLLATIIITKLYLPYKIKSLID